MNENDGMEALKELMSISNIMDLKHPNIINLCGTIERSLQALTTPKFSEDDLEFIFKWANRGIWQEREKRFNIMRRIKNPSTLSCYKIIIKELNSNYDRIRTLKSIGGNK